MRRIWTSTHDKKNGKDYNLVKSREIEENRMRMMKEIGH